MSPRAAGLRLPGAWCNVLTLPRASRRRQEPDIDTPERRGGGDRKISAASRAFARVSIALLGVLAAQLGAYPVLAQAVTPPGTQVHNYAEAHFDRAVGRTETVRSNEVVTTVVPGRSRAAVQFVRTVASGSGTASTSGPTSCLVGGVYQPLANPVLIGGQTLDPAQPVPLAGTGMYHGGEPFFVRPPDPHRHRDATVLDTVG